jgi:hypothetical protein
MRSDNVAIDNYGFVQIGCKVSSAPRGFFQWIVAGALLRKHHYMNLERQEQLPLNQRCSRGWAAEVSEDLGARFSVASTLP